MDVKHFFETDVPGRYHDTVRELETRVQKLQRRLEDVKAADATVRIVLTGEGGGEWRLHVEDGEMTVGADVGEELLFTMSQSVVDFEAAQSGEVEFGLAAPAGSQSHTREQTFARGMLRFLTASRARRLSPLKGSIHFEVTKVGGDEERTWGLIWVLGPGDVPDEAECKVSVTHADSKLMAEGKLAPPAAFMAGKVRITGNTGLAMQVGTLMMSG